MHTEGMIRGSLTHQGRERTYLLRESTVPTDAVLIYFHGSQQSGSVGRKFTNNTFDAVACHVVYPDGVEQHWNDARIGLHEKTRDLGVDDVGFVTALLARLHGYLGFSRVFLAGYSNGGQMVMRLLHDAPGLLAGAATFAATMPAEGNRVDGLGEADTPTPYLAMHGTADHIVKYDGGVAGLDDAHSRGVLVSAFESARYFAATNGLDDSDHEAVPGPEGVTVDRWSREGVPTVELWSIEGMGHVVPTPKQLPASIGPGTDSVVASDVLARFFGWE